MVKEESEIVNPLNATPCLQASFEGQFNTIFDSTISPFCWIFSTSWETASVAQKLYAIYLLFPTRINFPIALEIASY